jgi:spore maturation protein CgeB
MKLTNYQTSMTALFADPKKFSKLHNDPSLTQLSSLQNYLRIIHNRNEIDDETYKNIRPQST